MKKVSRNRVAFTMLYNPVTSKVVQMTADGMKAQEISERLGVSTMTVAAVKANLTRGSYFPFAYTTTDGRVYGKCSF